MVLGVVGGIIMFLGAHEHVAGRLSVGDYVEYTMLLAFMIAPIVQLGLDWDAVDRGAGRA